MGLFQVFRTSILTALICALFGAGSTSFAGGPKGTLVLNEPLTKELNAILKAGDSVHHSLVDQDEEQTDIGLRDLLKQIARARSRLYLAKDYERPHLVRILDAAKEQFELSQTAYGNERRTRLSEGFNQLVNLVRIYKLDKTYGIYFCPVDKSTWVQTGSKAQDPFPPAGSRQPCGIRVER